MALFLCPVNVKLNRIGHANKFSLIALIKTMNIVLESCFFLVTLVPKHKSFLAKNKTLINRKKKSGKISKN